MEESIPSVGEYVYFYSIKLDEIAYGRVEGYASLDYRVLKILQEKSDGYIRHVVSSQAASKNQETVEAFSLQYKREKVNEEISRSVYAGCVVHLYTDHTRTELVTDKEGNPMKYQVIAVYTRQARVKLVTDYGEEIGMYEIHQLQITDHPTIFVMENHEVGESVVWAEYEDVYEGQILQLHTSMAEIGKIKKLYPWDYKRKIPYYKIYDGNKRRDASSDILITISDHIPDGEMEK